MTKLYSGLQETENADVYASNVILYGQYAQDEYAKGVRGVLTDAEPEIRGYNGTNNYRAQTFVNLATSEVWEQRTELLPTIADYKERLTSTDYKIIKCCEYQLTGSELPYDIAALHSERQNIRDKINALEIVNASETI